MKVVDKRSCPTCGRALNTREVNLSGELVKALAAVTRWAVAHKVTQFRRRDIKHLFNNETVTANFGNWQYFGDILKHPEGKRGHWQINLQAAVRFLKDEEPLPSKVWVDHTGPVRYEDPKLASQIARVKTDADGDYVVRYKDQPSKGGS